MSGTGAWLIQPGRRALLLVLMVTVPAGCTTEEGPSEHSSIAAATSPSRAREVEDTVVESAGVPPVAEDVVIGAVQAGTRIHGRERRPRIYVLDEDAPGIPEEVAYDEVITILELGEVFLPEGAPERRALVVTKELVERVEAPSGGHTDAGGAPEYYALMAVLWNQHVLFGVDSSSELIGTGLELDGVPTPFDPFGRQMPIRPERSGYVLTGTGLAFSVDSGWKQQVIESLGGNEPTPGDPRVGSARSSKPAYDLVNELLAEMLGL